MRCQTHSSSKLPGGPRCGRDNASVPQGDLKSFGASLLYSLVSTRWVRRADCNEKSQIWWTASMISCPTPWPTLALATEQHCPGNGGQADPCVPHSAVPCLPITPAAGAWGSLHAGPQPAGVLHHLTHAGSPCLVLRSTLFPSWHRI